LLAFHKVLYLGRTVWRILATARAIQTNHAENSCTFGLFVMPMFECNTEFQINLKQRCMAVKGRNHPSNWSYL